MVLVSYSVGIICCWYHMLLVSLWCWYHIVLVSYSVGIIWCWYHNYGVGIIILWCWYHMVLKCSVSMGTYISLTTSTFIASAGLKACLHSTLPMAEPDVDQCWWSMIEVTFSEWYCTVELYYSPSRQFHWSQRYGKLLGCGCCMTSLSSSLWPPLDWTSCLVSLWTHSLSSGMRGWGPSRGEWGEGWEVGVRGGVGGGSEGRGGKWGGGEGWEEGVSYYIIMFLPTSWQ